MFSMNARKHNEHGQFGPPENLKNKEDSGYGLPYIFINNVLVKRLITTGAQVGKWKFNLIVYYFYSLAKCNIFLVK